MITQSWHMLPGESPWHATRSYRLISKEQRRMEQMDKLRRTLARSERKRREKELYR